jgi:hypothetical protein
MNGNRRVVIAFPGDQPRARSITPGENSEAVMFDLVNPAGPGPAKKSWNVVII